MVKGKEKIKGREKTKGKEKKTFSKISTFDVRANHPFRLVIAKGSVVDFSYPPNPQCSAIVNSFLGRINNGSSNGFAGGVDGAVSDAGGRNLKEDRKNLTVSCSVGSAVISESRPALLVAISPSSG